MGLIEGSVLVFMCSTKPRVDKTVFVQASVFILPRNLDSAVLVVVLVEWAALKPEVVPWRHWKQKPA